MEYLPGNLEIENNPFELDVWDKLTAQLDRFEGIMGYKIPSLGFKENEDIPSFIIRTPIHGITLLDVVGEKVVGFDEENEYWQTQTGEFVFSKDVAINQYSQELEGRLKKNKELFNIRKTEWKFNIPIRRFLIFYDNKTGEIKGFNEGHDVPLMNGFAGYDTLEGAIAELFPIKDDAALEQPIMDVVDSVLDGSEVFSKVKKKKVLENPDVINDFIKKSLDHTFKLDKIQRQVAMQVPPGPQRIRGLAGTGKTVILCMKAALAHKAFADLKILFVFNTQSMYNQVRNAITEYYFNEAKALPNWNNLHVYHAWGGSSKAGVYYNVASSVGIKPKNLFDVRGSDNPLEAIYSDLLKQAKGRITPEYDVVLIDEAQDFGPAFFETIFYITKSVDGDQAKKRIVWAYDEFQSLTDLKISQPEELFGLNDQGKPNMPNSALEGKYKGNIEKDFVLPNSYRNPRINLMVAHGIALGLYSQFGEVPMEDSRDWVARGYVVHQPQKQIFEEGDQVVVERPERYSKNLLERLLKQAEKDEKKLISFTVSETMEKQLNDVINRVEWLITKQKVEPEEIVVINLDTRNSKEQFEYIRHNLDIKNIKAITPGYIEANDAFKEPGFVTLSTAFRAKGNEANIVLLVNSQRVITDKTFRMRNAAFVSITRSRGWCYIYGSGAGAAELEKEVSDIIAEYPFFRFPFPNEDQIKRKITIIKSNKDVERADKEIDKLLSEEAYRALLIEKLAQDDDIIEALKKLKGKANDD